MTTTATRVEEILSSLGTEEKRELLRLLLPEFARKWREPRVLHDLDGTFLGDFIPAEPAGPPEPLSEETRLWLSRQYCKSSEDWKKEIQARGESVRHAKSG